MGVMEQREWVGREEKNGGENNEGEEGERSTGGRGEDKEGREEDIDGVLGGMKGE